VKIFKMWAAVLGVLLAMVMVFSATNAQAAPYIESFSLNNAQWFYGYGANFVSPQNSATWVGIGGNPDGYISGDSSNLYAVWTYTTTPYGDMTGLTLQIDTKVTDGETGNAQFYVGRGGAYFIDGSWAIGSDTTWTTHTTILDSAHFTHWTGVDSGAYTLAQVLQAPDDIGIFFGGGLANGTGLLEVDNYGTRVPEPGTLLLLGGGLVGLYGFRKKLFSK
jgi:hypothetical protein